MTIPPLRIMPWRGTIEYSGIKCQPVFQAVREHLKQYTPEKAAEISSVPAEKLRRIASEFVNAASIGSTIEIDGHSPAVHDQPRPLFSAADRDTKTDSMLVLPSACLTSWWVSRCSGWNIGMAGQKLGLSRNR